MRQLAPLNSLWRRITGGLFYVPPQKREGRSPHRAPGSTLAWHADLPEDLLFLKAELLQAFLSAARHVLSRDVLDAFGSKQVDQLFPLHTRQLAVKLVDVINIKSPPAPITRGMQVKPLQAPGEGFVLGDVGVVMARAGSLATCWSLFGCRFLPRQRERSLCGLETAVVLRHCRMRYPLVAAAAFGKSGPGIPPRILHVGQLAQPVS